MRVRIGKFPGPRAKKPRRIDVHIDDWDVWNLDETLALIIHPALIKLKEVKHGSPKVDDEDVPEHLRSTAAPPKENDWDMDDNWHLRWEWVLDEMIWAFEQKLIDWEDQYYSGNPDIMWEKTENGLFEMKRGPNDTYKVDREGLEAHYARIKNGIRLFAKYYDGLWD